jgi:hypothetical protein
VRGEVMGARFVVIWHPFLNKEHMWWSLPSFQSCQALLFVRDGVGALRAASMLDKTTHRAQLSENSPSASLAGSRVQDQNVPHMGTFVGLVQQTT